ncbi:MAG: MarR family transcriptional regulator [Chloroflexota bacterium]|nr:MAG: MarR family transcriptional regulator [Chloroflexota bacterium]
MPQVISPQASCPRHACWPISRIQMNSVMIMSRPGIPDDARRQADIDEVARISSNQLLQTWLIIDRMLPEQLKPIRDGLKKRRTRSGQETRLATNFMMFVTTAGYLHRNGSLTMGELSRATAIPQSTATRMVDWMVDNGYVDRFQDDEDRRVVRIRLTESGRDLLLAAQAQVRELSALFLKRLPAVQRAILISGMTDIVGVWQRVQEEQVAAAHSEEQAATAHSEEQVAVARS